MAKLSGNIEHFTFTINGVDQPLKVVRFQGAEGLSKLFRYQLELAFEDPELDFAAIVGQGALLTLYNEHEEVERHVHGIIHQFTQGEQGRRLTTYHAEVVPQLQLLSYRQDCRIFQNQTVPDIVQAALDKAGFFKVFIKKM